MTPAADSETQDGAAPPSASAREETSAEAATTEASRPHATSGKFEIGRLLRTWRRRLALPSAVVVAWALCVALAPVGPAAPHSPQSPGAAMSAYLEAVRDHDVERALQYVAENPGGESARFLRDALGVADWDIVDVVENDNDGVTARVSTTIDVDGVPHSGESTLSWRGGAWQLDAPFAEVRFAASPLWHVEVDGVTGPFAPVTPDQTYLLFPGVHQFYQSAADVIDVAAFDAEALFPGVERVVSPAETLQLNANSQLALQRHVEGFVDECAEQDDPAPEIGCPFSVEFDLGKRVEDEFVDVEAQTWDVVEYPEVTAAPGEYGFTLDESSNGSVELHATGRPVGDDDADPTEFSVVCEIDLGGYEIGVFADGELSLAPAGQWHGQDSGLDYRPRIPIEACREP